MKTIDVNVIPQIVVGNTQLISKVGANVGTQIFKVDVRLAWPCANKNEFEAEKRKYETGEKKGFILNRSPRRLLAKNILITGVCLVKDPMDDEICIAINPHDEDALLYKAQALMQLQNYEEACAYFRRNARLRKLNVDGHLNAGLCLLQLKKDEEALKELATAERHARRSHSDKLSEVLREEVFAYSHHGDMAKAFKCVEQMEKAGCDVDEATVLRGHIHLENGQVDEARQCYIEAIEHSKYGGLVMLQAAVSLYDNDYLDSAYNILSQISSEDLERYPSTYVYLAICAHDLGKRSDYIKYLQEAVGKAPHVARLLLAPFFPEGMEPSEYYQYALNDLEMS